LASAIIFKQRFDGKWGNDVLTSIPALANSTLVSEAIPEGVDDALWITSIVIAYFLLSKNIDEGIWQLHVKKARRTIAKILGERFEQVLDFASEFVSNILSTKAN